MNILTAKSGQSVIGNIIKAVLLLLNISFIFSLLPGLCSNVVLSDAQRLHSTYHTPFKDNVFPFISLSLTN